MVNLAKIDNPKKVIPTTIEIVDIAGLVKGASKGEGLGNKFLANIRETDAIIHVLRCFENDNITHLDGTIDPVRDKEIIDTELQPKGPPETIEPHCESAETGRHGENPPNAFSKFSNNKKRPRTGQERTHGGTRQGRPQIARDLQPADRQTGVLCVCNVDEKSAVTEAPTRYGKGS